MQSRYLLAALGGAALISGVTPASAKVVVTFEGHANTIHSAPISREGYLFGNPAGQEQHFHEIDSTQFGLPNNGTGVLLNDRDTEIFLDADVGTDDDFILNSVDVAAALGNLPADGMTITGFLDGNQTGQIVIASLGSGYTNVDGTVLGLVDFVLFDGTGGQGGFVLDNVAINVPEPTSLALVALGGLAALRRRR